MLEIAIANERQKQRFEHHAGPLEFGRSSSSAGVRRCVVMDQHVSRDQLRIEELSAGRVRLTNLGRPFALPDGRTLEQHSTHDAYLPLRLVIGYTTFDIAVGVERDDELVDSQVAQSLQTLAPKAAPLDRQAAKALLAENAVPSPTILATWFATLLAVQKAAAGSAEFYAETAKAVVELIGLDRSLVLLRDGGDWKIQAEYGIAAPSEAPYSRTVLDKVSAEGQTFYQSPRQLGSVRSLVHVEAVVAAPVFDAENRVVGIVYGSRDLRTEDSGGGVTALEAQLVGVLAGAVSNGLARLEQEAEAARQRVQLERFVSPQVAAELERNPQLLEGDEREITVLFTDLRGFTAIAQRLGARDTYRLAGEILDRLTQAVMDHAGTIIDYYGDGFAAMWNAPLDQPDHAEWACRAALAMLAALPDLNAQWHARIGAPIRIGVGINTGPAQVGNAGSRRRLKYGPRGHTVNLASRIEGATKFFEVSSLVSRATRQRLGDRFALRRIGRVQVVGVQEEVELWELYGEQADPAWIACRERYESLLRLCEAGQWAAAQAEIATVLQDPTTDSPTRVLAKTFAQARETAPAHPAVFQLDRK